ncbi:MAG TPA: tetratricopeptide repeat protein [Cytophagaceae bacterium]|jgi:tetratricopeptide (TPR) repeat protein|nr:tetratricopeptide repeat protein [Cytophagaceae bacterium]
MYKLFICFGIVFHATFSFCQNANTYQEQAKQKSIEKKYKEAIALCSKAIELDLTNPDYYIDRSNYHLAAGNQEEGFHDMNTAIKINPKYPLAYMQRGIFYYLIGEIDKSILDYTEALKYTSEKDTLKKTILINRASAKHQRRDFEGAILDCEEAIKIDSLSVQAINNLAMALEEVGRDNETLFYLKKVIRIDSTLAYPYMNIGFWLSRHKEYKESIKYFDKSLQIDSHQAYTYNNRGYSKLMLQDYTGALDDINKSLKLDPTNSYAYRNKGLLYLELGKKNKACEEWNMAIRHDFTKIYGNEVEEFLKKNCLQ